MRKSQYIVKVGIPLILLLMILMRLVWMQLREFPPEITYRAYITNAIVNELSYKSCISDSMSLVQSIPLMENEPAWFASPGLYAFSVVICRLGARDIKDFTRWNQWVVVSNIIACAFLARILTGSWLISLVVATTLLSRGSLLANISQISENNLTSLSLSAWIAASAAFVRSGAKIVLFLAALLLIMGAAQDRSLLILIFILPLWALTIALPKTTALPAPKMRPILAALNSFSEWLRSKPNRRVVYQVNILALIVGALAAFSFVIALPPPVFPLDVFAITEQVPELASLKLHTALQTTDPQIWGSAGLFIILFLLGRKVMSHNLFECHFFILVSLLLLSISVFLCDLTDWALGKQAYNFPSSAQNFSDHGMLRDLAFWTKPLIITLGVTSIYNLLVFANRSFRKNTRWQFQWGK